MTARYLPAQPGESYPNAFHACAGLCDPTIAHSSVLCPGGQLPEKMLGWI